MRQLLVLAILAVGSGLASDARQPIKVTIDVKPGEEPTSLEPNREGMVPLAILSTAAFDASTIDLTSITALACDRRCDANAFGDVAHLVVLIGGGPEHSAFLAGNAARADSGVGEAVAHVVTVCASLRGKERATVDL